MPPLPKAEGESLTHWEIYYAVYLAFCNFREAFDVEFQGCFRAKVDIDVYRSRKFLWCPHIYQIL